MANDFNEELYRSEEKSSPNGRKARDNALNKKNLIWFLAAALLLLCSTLYKNNNRMTLSMKNDILTVNGPKGFSYVLPFHEITNVELVAFPEGAEIVSGGTAAKIAYGERKDAAGTYLICAYVKLDQVVRVTASNGVVICIGYESTSTTNIVYQDIIEIMAADYGRQF